MSIKTIVLVNYLDFSDRHYGKSVIKLDIKQKVTNLIILMQFKNIIRHSRELETCMFTIKNYT